MIKKRITILPMLALFLLGVSCSKDDETNEETPKEGDKSTIMTYTDVELKLTDSDKDNLGIAFSSKDGKTYKASEINKGNIANIDIVSFVSRAMTAFDSPDKADATKDIEGATKTKIQHTNVKMTDAEFDAIKDDSAFKNLTVVDDNESQPSAYKGVILFENAAGKKGALKLKAHNAERVLMDVKVVK